MEKKSNDRNVRRLALAGVLCALTVVLTLISVPIPGGHGYLNLGDAAVLTTATLLGGPWGIICAGVGSALADILLGYVTYAPATLLIKALVAFVAWELLKNRDGRAPIVSYLIAVLLVPTGYFLYETALYGYGAAVVNIAVNLMQGVVGAFLAWGVHGILMRIKPPQRRNNDKDGEKQA